MSTDAQRDPSESDEPHGPPFQCFDCKKIVDTASYSATGVDYPGVGPDGLVTHYIGHRYFCHACMKERDDADIRRAHGPDKQQGNQA